MAKIKSITKVAKRRADLMGESDPSKWKDKRSALIWSLFGGRPDILAQHWRNKDRSGYSPVCLKKGLSGCPRKTSRKYSCSKCKVGEYAGINDKIMTEHINGDMIIGTYTLKDDNTCHYIAADFDCKGGAGAIDPLPEVKEYVEACLQEGIPTYVLKSKSGFGYHVYTFLEAWVPAWKIRGVILSVMEDLELKSFDRLFPTQDRLTNKGMGNLIALPFQGKAIEGDNTIILDPTTDYRSSFNNQDKILNNISKLSLPDLDILVEAHHIEEPGPDSTTSQTSRDDYPDDAIADNIIAECQFIKHCMDDAEVLPEPEWWSMISIISRCINGPEEVHRFSEPYPTYDYDETTKKILTTLDGTGPHTCSFIQEHVNDDYCKDCKWTDIVRSPIQLGPKTPDIETLGVVETMNKIWAVVPVGGDTRIVRHDGQDCSYFREAGFKLLLKNQKIKIPKGKKIKEVTKAEYWLEHPDRREFKGEVFIPGPTPEGMFNRFKGYQHPASKGEWNLFDDHIRHVICNGNEDIYEYVITWVADAVQNIADVDSKPGTAIAMIGGQGTGKSTFGKAIVDLFKPYSTTIIDSNRLTSRFNDFLANSLIIFADEGFNVKTKSGRSILRGMLTSPDIAMERKGLPQVVVPNYSRLIFASNERHILSMTGDDRRFLVLDINGDRAGDRAYFGTLYQQMYRDGGLEAFRYDMEKYPIKRNLRDIPRTKAQEEQKIESLDSVGQYWLEILSSGINNIDLFDTEITGDKEVKQWVTKLVSGDLHKHYLEWCVENKIKGFDIISNSPTLVSLLKTYMPPSTTSSRRRLNGRIVRTLILPDYDECLSFFEGSMKVTI